MSRRSRPHYRPGRSGLHRDYLSFGAAVRLGLLPHTASRRQGRRLTTATTACSCLWLAVATISPREGLSPPIQCPCQAHPVGLRPPSVPTPMRQEAPQPRQNDTYRNAETVQRNGASSRHRLFGRYAFSFRLGADRQIIYVLITLGLLIRERSGQFVRDFGARKQRR